MTEIIQFFADILGVPYTAVEGSVATALTFFVLFLLRLLWDASKRDNKQVDLERTLVQLVADALSNIRKNNEVIEANAKAVAANTVATERVSTVLSDVSESLSTFSRDLKSVVLNVQELTEKTEQTRPVLDSIRDNLIKTSDTVIIIRDSNGNDIGKLHASPNEKGELIVQFSLAEIEDNE